jgi:DNA-binding winged helix-turn-helix (wHTH) protein
VSRLARFGPFEADLATGELRKNGVRLRLQPRCFHVLAILLERPGQLVTRDQLRGRLWPADVVVDEEHGLNKAVSKLREILGEPSDHPRFIETLPRRGYRFVATLDAAPAPPVAIVARLLYRGRTIALSAGVHVLGRDEGSSVHVDATTVSRRHATLVLEASQATIQDLGSKNGTRVNDRRISGVAVLSDGDCIQLGSIALTFRVGTSDSTRSMSASSPAIQGYRTPSTS